MSTFEWITFVFKSAEIVVLYGGILGNALVLLRHCQQRRHHNGFSVFIVALASYDLILCVSSLLMVLNLPLLLESMYECHGEIIVTSKVIIVSFYFLLKPHQQSSTAERKLLEKTIIAIHLGLVLPLCYYCVIHQNLKNVWGSHIVGLPLYYKCCGKCPILRVITLILLAVSLHRITSHSVSTTIKVESTCATKGRSLTASKTDARGGIEDVTRLFLLLMCICMMHTFAGSFTNPCTERFSIQIANNSYLMLALHISLLYSPCILIWNDWNRVLNTAFYSNASWLKILKRP